jgi:hypothetical protein
MEFEPASDVSQPPEGFIVRGRHGEVNLELQETEQDGVYTATNGVLTTCVVRLEEFYESKGIEPVPADFC